MWILWGLKVFVELLNYGLILYDIEDDPIRVKTFVFLNVLDFNDF